jgi:hypothetical protein
VKSSWFRQSASGVYGQSRGIGFAAAGAAVIEPASGASLRFDTKAGCAGCGGSADTTFKFESTSGGTHSTSDTLQTPATANFYKLTIENGGASNKLIFNLLTFLFESSSSILTPPRHVNSRGRSDKKTTTEVS